MPKTKKDAPATTSDTSKQANRFDKILKENLKRAIPGLLRNVLGLNFVSIRAVSVELQHTRERKADFIAIVTDETGAEQVLHIEFQARNDSKMLHRELDYKVLLRRRYPPLPILQYVIFLGKNAPTMKAVLDEPDHFFRYNLLWIGGIDYQKFVKSKSPEEVLLAVLAKYTKENAEQVAEEIITRLRLTAPSDLDFQRFTQQLRVLANLRNLQPLIDALMEKTTRFFVVARDPLYRQGKTEGLQEGKLEGILEGKAEGKLEGQREKARAVVVNLLCATHHGVDEIARLSGESEEFVKNVKFVIDLLDNPDYDLGQIMDLANVSEEFVQAIRAELVKQN